MWSIARKSTLVGSVSRIAQKTLARPVVLISEKQRRLYHSGDAKAEKVSLGEIDIYG